MVNFPFSLPVTHLVVVVFITNLIGQLQKIWESDPHRVHWFSYKDFNVVQMLHDTISHEKAVLCGFPSGLRLFSEPYCMAHHGERINAKAKKK